MKDRDWISYVCIFLGILGVLDTFFVLSLSGGINLGTILPAVIGVILVAWGLWENWVKANFLRRHFLVFQKFIRFLFLLMVSTFLLVQVLLIMNTEDPFPEQVEYMIILGAGLNGEQMSWTLLERVNKGLQILQDNPYMKVVVSGGQGPGEAISEAEAMALYLEKNGIPSNRIIMETQSTSTMENFFNSRILLEEIEDFSFNGPVLIITSDFHMYRSKILAERNGLKPVGIPCYTPWYIRPNVYLREYFALIKSLIFDW